MRVRPTLMLLAASLSVVAGCALPGTLGRGRAASLVAPAASASLTLRVADLQEGTRRLLNLDTRQGTRLTITDATGATLSDQMVTVEGGVARLTGLPVAPRVVVSLRFQNPANSPFGTVPSVRTVGSLVAGPNTLTIDRHSNVAADVLEALIALDREAGTAVASGVSFGEVPGLVVGWQRALKAPQPDLLDARAIARAWQAAKAMPLTDPSFYPRPARLVIKPRNWPVGGTVFGGLSDRVTQPFVLTDEDFVLDPVPPGSWSLRILVPDGERPATAAYPVNLAPGETGFLTVAMPGVEPATPLRAARGAGMWATVPRGASQALMIAGGTVLAPRGTEPGPAVVASDIVFVPEPGAPQPAALPEEVCAAAFAQHEGHLYWFGGLGPAGVSAESGRLDLTTRAVEARAPLPDGLRLSGAVAATVGPRIYVLGGVGLDGLPSARAMAYSPGTDTWSMLAVPSLPRGASGLAAAVVGDRIFVFGGQGVDVEAKEPVVFGDVWAWRPGGEVAWAKVTEMPTPRAGASALVVNGRIWVIGGLDARLGLSAAVEVFDPLAGTWSRRPSLSVARGSAAVGLVDGRVVVAGGLLGVTPTGSLPVADVERLVP